MKVEVAVLGSPSLIVLTVSVALGNIKVNKKKYIKNIYISELRSCVEVGGGRPGLPVPNSPYGLCGLRKY